MDNTPTSNNAQADSTEQRIFDAAHEVFVQKGLDGAKMQEIADKAGINKALLHYYYRSKEKLFEEVARFVLHRAVPVVRQTLESDRPIEEKLNDFIDFYIELISKNTFVPLFLINEMNKRPQHFFDNILPRDRPHPDKFLQQVTEAVAAGDIRPIDGRHLIINVVSMCVFPFIGRPMMQVLLGMRQEEMQAFLLERKKQVKEFVWASLRPEPNNSNQ
jgi:TetR/AcrR family transcriptional regulator